ncbi:hypothetical protein HanXRQr2_Chr15g0683501 [Helianthus annuus]|uniref:Uncharacterized protein n=1 Tax=Helianthus annuus TaxID=4232 RepID=A0A251S7G8_HELAN|nr:hypothetical protein HanXRQr2_Chr15g0683501 [Helianthus annuus]KAJ0454630.1 hypothetical protein HanIR_Chr15g0742301 [Helianthus annuus]KAJ0472335.1 hypothetical protein HanHA89_Chr15g0605901 [Helianthus annuus]KAJ0647932.1 hypothetical protein HanLR1_Chr15g0567221 [Helianthus annuus]KAJ0830436.1 hypothetical protein HanPSC8_Chr15g0655411 [Helianthus annuus]
MCMVDYRTSNSSPRSKVLQIILRCEEGNIGFFYKLLCCCTKIMCKGLWINDDKRAAICNAAMLIPIGYFLIRYGLYKPSLFTGQP